MTSETSGAAIEAQARREQMRRWKEAAELRRAEGRTLHDHIVPRGMLAVEEKPAEESAALVAVETQNVDTIALEEDAERSYRHARLAVFAVLVLALALLWLRSRANAVR